MKGWMLGLTLFAIIGCGRNEQVASNRDTSGPTVDISVEPLRWKKGPVQNSSSRAQTLSPQPNQNEPEVQPRDEERPRRKRKKPKPQHKHEAKKPTIDFGELSEEERRRLIEG